MAAGAARRSCPFSPGTAAAYDTLMSPPLSSCGVEFGSTLGCDATGV